MFKSFHKLLESTFWNNFIHLSLNQGTNVLVALIVTPYLFQTLGEVEFGLVNLALTTIMLLSILVNYGFHLNGPRRLALLRADKFGTQVLINEILQTRILLSFTAALLLLIVVKLGNYFPGHQDLLIYSSILLLNEAIFPFLILQGFDRISWVSIANPISKGLYLLAVVWLIKEPSDAFLVNFLLGLTALTVNTGLLIFIFRAEGFLFVWTPIGRIFTQLKGNFQFFLSTIAGHISIHGGLIILSNFVSEFEIGQYSLSQRIAFLLRLIPTFIIQSILQKAAKLHGKDVRLFDKYLSVAYRGGLLATFMLGFIVLFTSKYIILLLSGEYIAYSTQILQVLAFIPFCSALNVSNMVRILVKEQKKVLALSTWITTVFMIISAVIGSMIYGGIGLAIALLFTEFVSFLVHFYFLRTK
ncbi:MAG: O-antigen/teichoic acid export membrane protein [Parvicella sp.]